MNLQELTNELTRLRELSEREKIRAEARNNASEFSYRDGQYIAYHHCLGLLKQLELEAK